MIYLLLHTTLVFGTLFYTQKALPRTNELFKQWWSKSTRESNYISNVIFGSQDRNWDARFRCTTVRSKNQGTFVLCHFDHSLITFN
jgi:hypothetical protein